jgi:hypothetical protein
MSRELDHRHARFTAIVTWTAWTIGITGFFALYAWSWQWVL